MLSGSRSKSQEIKSIDSLLLGNFFGNSLVRKIFVWLAAVESILKQTKPTVRTDQHRTKIQKRSKVE